jgi:hypothetical protein
MGKRFLFKEPGWGVVRMTEDLNKGGELQMMRKYCIVVVTVVVFAGTLFGLTAGNSHATVVPPPSSVQHSSQLIAAVTDDPAGMEIQVRKFTTGAPLFFNYTSNSSWNGWNGVSSVISFMAQNNAAIDLAIWTGSRYKFLQDATSIEVTDDGKSVSVDWGSGKTSLVLGNGPGGLAVPIPPSVFLLGSGLLGLLGIGLRRERIGS